MSDTTETKPEIMTCPLCGTVARLRSIINERFRCQCTNEDCETATAFFDTEEEAMVVWNTRVKPVWIYPSRGGELPDSGQEIYFVPASHPNWVQEGQYIPAWDHSFLGTMKNCTTEEVLCWQPRVKPEAPVQGETL